MFACCAWVLWSLIGLWTAPFDEKRGR